MISVVGNVCNEPELKFTRGTNTPVCIFRVAQQSSRVFNGKRGVHFYTVVCWGQQADFAYNYISVGSLVRIEGHHEPRVWTGNDGVKRTEQEIQAISVRHLARPRKQERADDMQRLAAVLTANATLAPHGDLIQSLIQGYLNKSDETENQAPADEAPESAGDALATGQPPAETPTNPAEAALAGAAAGHDDPFVE